MHYIDTSYLYVNFGVSHKKCWKEVQRCAFILKISIKKPMRSIELELFFYPI